MDTVGLVASSITIAGFLCISMHHVLGIVWLFFSGAEEEFGKLQVSIYYEAQ